MGQKIHPTGFRLAVTRAWSSRWFANSRDFPAMLDVDNRVRKHLKQKLSHASVSRVLIERPARNARVTVYSARPGVVIGKKGEDIEIIRSDLQRIMGVPVHISIEEIRKPEIDAQLIADSITQQLEKRIMFRRAMKRAMQNAMRLGAQGIKVMSAGRLNGAEIARTEWYREGRVPLHTLRADIDYATSEAKTTYGIIGVKVWVYKGEMQGEDTRAEAAETVDNRKPRRSDGVAAKERSEKAGDDKAEVELKTKPKARTVKEQPEEQETSSQKEKEDAKVATGSLVEKSTKSTGVKKADEKTAATPPVTKAKASTKSSDADNKTANAPEEKAPAKRRTAKKVDGDTAEKSAKKTTARAKPARNKKVESPEGATAETDQKQASDASSSSSDASEKGDD